MDVTSAETKVTYDEIKKYVAEHNDGMKVSNLYISQVKKNAELRLERIIICQKQMIVNSHNVRKKRKKQLWRHWSILR